MKLKIKAFVATIICQPIVGTILAQLFQNHIPSRGFRFTTKNPLVFSKIKAQLFWGIYESGEIRFVEKYVRKDLDVVELGAGIGVVTCFLRNLVDGNRKVIAVEANPGLVPEIKNNLVLNKLWENVILLHGAVDYEPKQMARFSLNDNYLGYLGGKVDQTSQTTTIDVASVTLEAILRENDVSDYVLVMDIEGTEAAIIKYDSDQLSSCKQLIAELHDTIIEGKLVTVQEMADDLVLHHGFKIVDHYGPVMVFEK